MAKYYDRAYFEKQFEGLPRNAMVVIALRAAMRVLPVLARTERTPFDYWSKDSAAGHALALFRCIQASALFYGVPSLKAQTLEAYAAAAATSARVANATNAATARDVCYAAYDTAEPKY